MAKRAMSIGAVGGLALLAVLTVTVQPAAAQTSLVESDESAAYVIFPKIVVDTGGVFHDGRAVDTVIQLTNTKAFDIVVHCFYVDATSHCNNAPETSCEINSNCPIGGICTPSWQANNFTFSLTPRQPTAWRASIGTTPSGNVPGVGEDPFIGELKCVEVDDPGTLTPINSNDLIGNATIEEVTPGVGIVGSVDARAYNAIGIPALSNTGSTQTDVGSPTGEKVLCLGGNTASSECASAEFAACPSRLILNHLFDFSSVLGAVSTDLTLVPCSETLLNGIPQTPTTVQFLVFNEFEQRMSASTLLDCFKEIQLSNIDSPRDPRTSIFNIAVQGTLAGQTNVRPVAGSETTTGHGILGLAEQFRTPGSDRLFSRSSAAYNLNYSGSNANKADFVRYLIP